MKARQINDPSGTNIKLQKLRLQAEVARLRVAMWQRPENVATMVEHMQWQIDRMNEELIEK